MRRPHSRPGSPARRPIPAPPSRGETGRACSSRRGSVPLLAIPDELLEVRAAFRSFLEREVMPAEEAHREEINETGTFEAVKDERRRFQQRSAELGFWAMHMPEEVGGAGLGALG